MSLYRKLYRNIIFPFYSTFIKKSQIYNEYSRSESRLSLSTEELLEFQWQRLESLLLHCWLNVPFYKEHWNKSGIKDISEIKSLADFSKLPVLTKQDITKHYEQFIPENYKNKNIKKSTGGSTGTPFRFELDELSNDTRQAIMWRGYGWLGAGLGVKSLFLWGDNIGKTSWLRSLKENLYHRFYNRKMVSTFSMNLNNLAEYIATINNYKPEAIISYVNPLYEIARFINQNDIKVFSPDSLLTGAEPLYDFQRIEIEKAFKAKVYNTYGCREFMLIAAECQQQNGLHINIDHLVVETLDSEGNSMVGEAGDLAITDLMNYGMPLIRYINGDRATLTESKCNCANPLPIIEKINGRKLDVIKTSAGHMIPGELFPHLFKEFEGVVKFQVKQTELKSITIFIVKNDKFVEQNKISISTEIERYSKGELAINYKFVDDIALTPSGKYRVTISELPKGN
jgi:phenylacetate-CoA ligase